ncbi:methionine aminopeptidase [Bacillus infantis]|uniref:Methionine aminopeptidase n=1 Tax=Bacillus infantis TaxID=324767 RepID=A0A5D4RCZ7_9BACI|nr:methionine aminopeptidase [Bacillus infantis]TYS47756.1 methionine aminopeptidase [Bacillus infantis]
MGLLQSFQDWLAAREENRIAGLRAVDKCPDCFGRGFNAFHANEYVYYTNSLECPGCSGSGLYSAWEENRQF